MPLTLEQAEPIADNYRKELVGKTDTHTSNRVFRNDAVLIVPDSRPERKIFFGHYETESNYESALKASGWKDGKEVEIIVLQRNTSNNELRYILLNEYLDNNGEAKAY